MLLLKVRDPDSVTLLHICIINVALLLTLLGSVLDLCEVPLKVLQLALPHLLHQDVAIVVHLSMYKLDAL